MSRHKFSLMGFGALMMFFSSFGQTYFFGVLQPFLRAEYGLSVAEFGRLYLVVTLASALGVAMIGGVIDRIPLRIYALGLAVFMCMSMALFSLSSPLILVIIAMMALRLGGQGLMVHAAMTTMSRYYGTMRGRAIAVASAGIPLGQSLIPALLVLLLTIYPWRDAMLLVAAALPLILLPLVLLTLKGHSKRHALWLADSHAENKALGERAAISLRRRDVMRDWRFYALLPMLTVGPFWVTAVFFYAEQLGELREMDLATLTQYYWLHALGGVFVPLIAGTLVDQRKAISLIWMTPVLIAGTFIYLLIFGGGLPIFLFLLGIAVWMGSPIHNALWAELYGTEFLGEIKGLVNAMVVVSTALAPFILGELMAYGFSFGALLYGALIHGVTGFGLTLIIMISSRSKLLRHV